MRSTEVGDASPASHWPVVAASVDARLAEVARRYAWNAREARRNIPFDRRMAYWRLPELERIFADRYCSTLPDDDAGRGDLVVAFNHIAYRNGDVIARMMAWARTWAPWLSEAEASRVAIGIAKHPIRYKADTLGRLLRLTREERKRLGIKNELS